MIKAKGLVGLFLYRVGCNNGPVSIARMSTTKVPVRKEKVTPLLTLRTVSPERANSAENRSLVIFFTWLYASQGAIDKYCQLYHNRGMNVLSVSCELKHFLLPNTGKGVAKQLLDFLSTAAVAQNSQQLLVHSVSIGAFVYTVVMMEMADDASKYIQVRQKIKGQVFDSIVLGSLSEMAKGISQRSSNPLVRGLIRGGANTYFFMTRPFTVRFYDKSIEFFKEQPIRSTTVFYSSPTDPMCDAQVLRQMVQHWENDFDMDLVVKSWDKSQHAGHLMRYPDEYSRILNAYIDKCCLPSKSNL